MAILPVCSISDDKVVASKDSLALVLEHVKECLTMHSSMPRIYVYHIATSMNRIARKGWLLLCMASLEAYSAASTTSYATLVKHL